MSNTYSSPTFGLLPYAYRLDIRDGFYPDGFPSFDEWCQGDDAKYLAATGDMTWLTCEWFAACPNEATQFVAHPILVQVPTCARCAERA